MYGLKFATKYNLLQSGVFSIYTLMNQFLLDYKFSLVYHYYIENRILRIINQLRKRRILLLTVFEALQVYECAKTAQKIKGDFAEVGVYRGGSAYLISLAKKNKKLHLFDTFEGLPKISSTDRYVKSGDMSESLETVKEFLKKFKRIVFYKGVFPQTSPKRKINFAFVHLDVDIYQSTKDALEWFYPRMERGGMILTHDYPFLPGVKKAFDEFFKDKGEKVIKLTGNQGLVIKV